MVFFLFVCLFVFNGELCLLFKIQALVVAVDIAAVGIMAISYEIFCIVLE